MHSAKRHLFFFYIFALLVNAATAQEIRFNRDIRPILSDRCFHCHGPDEHDRKGKLRLDQSEGTHGSYRTIEGVTAIKPKSITDSDLWKRINTDDKDDAMPPTDSHKKALTAVEKKLIKQWIEEGAGYEDFWAFVPPRKPVLPSDIKNTKWSKNPVDLFVLRKLETNDLAPSPPADKRTLIRRVTFDLTGLPPSRDEVKIFLADTSAGSYEKLIDRLLAKRQYGEHMTKFWLDLVRFADTNGMHHDHYREMTPYRDWVIRAFNENLPYDKFATYQLAGDLYPKPNQDQLIASGFNRLHLIIDRGTALPEESFAKNVLDRVTSVGTAFMGMTVGCAVCHDHKYDPFTMKDFYSLSAFFNNIDAMPETGRRGGSNFVRGLQEPFINLSTPEQEAQLKKYVEGGTTATARARQLNQTLNKTNDPAKKKTLTTQVAQAKKDIKTAEAAKEKFEITIPAAMIMKERAEIRPAHILIRGAYDNPGEKVGRGSPGFLPQMKQKGKFKTRMDLAEWFVSTDNPLTARVAVNRFWQQLFGVGIVKTSEDFGAQGEWPSHPDLLDYLTLFFVESGWNTKALMKEIVMSKTYQQSSAAKPDQFNSDPENRLLARGSRYRMDSELIRDQVLATSGLLNATLFGKSVKPPQPTGLWKSVGMPYSYPKEFVADEGDKTYRRSVYTFWKRGMPPPQMTILNAPARDACIARRERTNTPLQALLLLNEQEYLNAARHLANRTLANRSLNPVEALNIVHETITSHLPDEEDRKTYLITLNDLKALYTANPKLAAQLCDGVKMSKDLTQAELAAWTLLVSTIYNLDATRTRQ